MRRSSAAYPAASNVSGRSLAVAAAEPVQLDVGEVEPVHGHVSQPPVGPGVAGGGQRLEHRLDQGRLAGAGVADDADDAAPAAGPGFSSPVEKVGEGGDDGHPARGVGHRRHAAEIPLAT